MRVGIDVSNFFAGLTNGTPLYLYNLLRAVARLVPDIEWVFVYHHWRTKTSHAVIADLLGPTSEVRSPRVASWVPPGGWWAPYHPPVRIFAGKVDIFHGVDFLRPAPGNTPLVVSVLDLTTVLHPNTHHWMNRWRDRWKLQWARTCADRIITISEATKRDIVALLGFDRARVDVTPLARAHVSISASDATEAAVRSRYGLGAAPFILSVGTLEPRKNHARLVHAFEQLPERFGDVQLVLAGGRGWKTAEIDRAIRYSRASPRIRTIGFVDEAELDGLYRAATVFAYPSLYEGFGLPLLEAMHAGIPVLTSGVSSLPEVAGDAAVFVDPYSVESIRDGLAMLLADSGLRSKLAALGLERERSFTWERTARLTLASYQRAISSSRAGAKNVAHGSLGAHRRRG